MNLSHKIAVWAAGVSLILLSGLSCSDKGSTTPEGGEKVIVAQATGSEARDLEFKSTARGKVVSYSVYLPKGWHKGGNYPVLYLLHGMYGDNNDWLSYGDLNRQASYAAALGEAPEMVVICPDGENDFYCQGSYAEFFFGEFIPFVEEEYSCGGSRAKRAVAGLSMGGYGTVYFSLLHPEMFRYAYGCSPAVGVSSESIPSLSEMVDKVSDPNAIPHITLESGEDDYVVSLSSVKTFCNFLKGKGISYDLLTREGAHDWTFWKACTPKIVRKVFAEE